MVVVEDGWVGEVVVWMCEVVLVGENIVVHHRCGRILGEIELEIGTEIVGIETVIVIEIDGTEIETAIDAARIL